MRYFIIIALAVSAFVDAERDFFALYQGGRIFESEAKAFLECVRKVLNEGLPEHGLPSLNPLEIANAALDLDKLAMGNILSGHITAKNLQISGITSWKTEKLSISQEGWLPPTAAIEVEFSFASTSGRGSYEGKIKANASEILGNGDAKVHLQGISVKVGAIFEILNIKLSKLSVKLLLDKAQIELTGLNNDPQLSQDMSKWLSEKLPAFSKENPDWFDKNFSEDLKKAINKMIASGGGLSQAILEKCTK